MRECMHALLVLGVLLGEGGASLGPGDLNVPSCTTPQVRSLDGVARALHCVELKPCRLHVVLREG